MRESGALGNLAPVGTDALPGASWHHGPLKFEKYVHDDQPPYDPTGPRRFVIWQRLTKHDVPAGWKRGIPGLGFRMTGFSRVEDGDPAKWSGHARRHLKHYNKLAAAGQREIFRTDIETYLKAYAKADQDRAMKSAYPGILREKQKAHGDLLFLMVSRRPGGPIDAGLAYLHIPEAKQSTHVSAFMAGAGKEDSAPTGLIAEWFAACAKAGLPYLDFGLFWAPGEGRDWYGFSRYKAQFAIRLIHYPRALYRWYGRSMWKEIFGIK